ncbi:ATP-binding protein [Frigidibacter mobilis]|uniref:histidine kinase n=1 Tax=Frigidibacter mobilis TaxID=1335048 RepID=A0A159Z3K9_9RHOB|nr:ATP-binding protein [Frigidibacter mobilis]AMY68828.1 integral membrane sensor signal transduction histidine kinase [Frigidibacter mobilis]
MSSDTQPPPSPQIYLPPPGPIRRFAPRSLYARAALILIVPVVALQLVVSVTVTQRLYEDVTRQMTRSLATGLDALVQAVEAAPDVEAARQTAMALAAPAGVVTSLPVEGPLQDSLAPADLSGRTVIGTLRDAFPGIRGVDLTASRAVQVAIETRHGLLGVEFDRRRVAASNPHQLLVLTAFTSLLMTGVAFLFLRNQLRPIRRLALAAEAFGRGRMVPYRPSGAVEVRSAGNAFLDMRARIERQIEQRTLMLSGVSHDLRTPLTRLKLSLAMMPEDEDTRAMARDIAEMQALIDAFLAFARGDAMEGEAETVDPLDFVREIAARAMRAGQPVREGVFEGQGQILLRRVAISRAVENLIGNAVRYGRRAEVGAVLTDRALVISVEDDGPGIPRERRDEAMRPFSRLDPARNQDGGSGVGLGLAIAADVARSHGGTLRLGDSARLGGLKAELVLPR